jgi:hypothetical protein
MFGILVGKPKRSTLRCVRSLDDMQSRDSSTYYLAIRQNGLKILNTIIGDLRISQNKTLKVEQIPQVFQASVGDPGVIEGHMPEPLETRQLLQALVGNLRVAEVNRFQFSQ